MEMLKVSQCFCVIEVSHSLYVMETEKVSHCEVLEMLKVSPHVPVCVQLKQLEIQLEEEYEDKQKVLRERRELDTKLISAQDQVPTAVTSTHTRSNPTVTGGDHFL